MGLAQGPQATPEGAETRKAPGRRQRGDQGPVAGRERRGAAQSERRPRLERSAAAAQTARRANPERPGHPAGAAAERGSGRARGGTRGGGPQAAEAGGVPRTPAEGGPRPEPGGRTPRRPDAERAHRSAEEGRSPDGSKPPGSPPRSPQAGEERGRDPGGKCQATAWPYGKQGPRQNCAGGLQLGCLGGVSPVKGYASAVYGTLDRLLLTSDFGVRIIRDNLYIRCPA